MMSPAQCQQARLARDRRYDGLFFTAVKTTGIYCRPICPAPPPLEKNVEYFPSAVTAAQAGYRPCLRCRPDSAPGSPAWRGKSTTFVRAQRLIDEGALIDSGLAQLAGRLGVTDRYLRRLFNDEMGLSPKAYSLYQQCLLAKKLLHESQLSITDIALASGFNSIRRFNDCFYQHFSLTPTQVRKQLNGAEQGEGKNQMKTVTVTLSYRPPYDWPSVRDFFASRLIEGLEWLDENSYGRTFGKEYGQGWFTAHYEQDKACFRVELSLSNLQCLPRAIANIRRCLDLDADSAVIDSAIEVAMGEPLGQTGLRLPGIWSPFEAGIRAILGQQVSVKAARNLVEKLILMNPGHHSGRYFFPEPEALGEYDLNLLGMPERRRETLRIFGRYVAEQGIEDANELLALPGIGPWTVDYLKMRGLSDPNIFLVGDLGVKKALEKRPCQPELAAPWQSYLTLYLWKTL
ncbi:DNA-3-methyladenine glycosylase 2 family protein [Photobacterium gaetbulicola]|uniref:DNA-3-methyladenine glycosylase II n=1 Tax=Photobacterium gaetbulicola Gung47 TaxID=658445 RepID=A0A0C5WNG8_9GAMM|nr:AlkA N-terminal domain-containing protein [Photobacterium gaetbulicola]AJR06614.1 Ada family regulatory protein [Photobacterium gaetbulicola Gung47]PSU13938.1 DNA-3-methyladenine glycosylase 2 family protein [Photobacterium gaetbulicola]